MDAPGTSTRTQPVTTDRTAQTETDLKHNTWSIPRCPERPAAGSLAPLTCLSSGFINARRGLSPALCLTPHRHTFLSARTRGLPSLNLARMVLMRHAVHEAELLQCGSLLAAPLAPAEQRLSICRGSLPSPCPPLLKPCVSMQGPLFWHPATACRISMVACAPSDILRLCKVSQSGTQQQRPCMRTAFATGKRPPTFRSQHEVAGGLGKSRAPAQAGPAGVAQPDTSGTTGRLSLTRGSETRVAHGGCGGGALTRRGTSRCTTGRGSHSSLPA